MSKIALLPGGFKPPHAGHYNMAKWLADNTKATVLVRVGAKERDGITREMSIKLWELYTQNDNNIIVKPSVSNSPVRDVYDFVEQEAPEGSTVFLGMGEKDSDDKRFANIGKFAEPKGIKFETVLVPPQAGGVSGTQMREFIKNNDKNSFQKYIPDHIDKDQAWNIVTNLEEDLYNPNDKVLDYMRSSEWKAGYRGKKDIPRTKDQIHNRQTNPHAHMSEDTQFEKGKVLHIYDFDDTIAQVKTNIKTIITSPNDPDFFQELDISSEEFPEKSKELEARLGHLNITYDFSEFDKQIGDAIINSKVVDKLKNSLSKIDIKTTILTARTIGHPVTRYLKDELGLSAYVVPLGLQKGGGRVTGKDKANWIEDHIKKGYHTIYFIDDSEENRIAVGTLKDKYPDIFLKIENPYEVSELMYGTMTKQEMEKHNKNLKRLKRDLKKQGDQYMEVPNYLKGTLTRKLDESKMSNIDLKKTKESYNEEYLEILNKFPEELQREIIDERPEGDQKDIDELKGWTLNKNKPYDIPLSTLITKEANIEAIERTPKEVIDKINTDWNLDIKPGKVHDPNPDRYLKYAKQFSGKTASPSIMINGEIYWGVGRMISALLRGDKTLKVWDIKNKKNIDQKDKVFENYPTDTDALYTTSAAIINDITIPLEVMSTPEEQIDGMMGRDKLKGGMIFIYDQISKKDFHMQGCKIPLDIVFLKDKKINKIHRNCPPCKKTTCPKYSGMADNVLELPGNYCKKHNINVGDDVNLNIIHKDNKPLYPLKEIIDKKELKTIDNFADKKLDPVDVDLTSDHFFNRLNDPRNNKEISNAELIGFFKRLAKKKKELFDFLSKYKEVVASDDRTNINIPFLKKVDKIIAKTILRKPNFQTSNPQLSLESTKMTKKENIFTKNWWKGILEEILLTEGGAAGHMAHPFNLPNVNNGKSLLDTFKKAADSLEKNPGAVKIDGVNASIRLVDIDGKKQFALDRGSKQALDIKGVTKADLEDRFKTKDGTPHGFIKTGGDVLDMFNEALPSLKNDLIKLGAWENPNILFNMEYVSGKTNVQKYDNNFIAIHGLNKIEMIDEPSAKTGKMLSKRKSKEISYDKKDLQSLLNNLTPTAKKRGFEVYGSVPTEMIKKPNFVSALSKNYTIKSNEGNKTQSLEKWLNELNNIPEETFIFIDGIKRGAVSKLIYTTLLNGGNIDELFESEEDKQAAIEGWTTYLATEKLGDEVLKVLDSPMGSADNHEGVVIRDKNIASVPFKITGKFILGGMATGFRQ
jgi:uncharacterized membrane protein (UPF0127 family)/glutaredoxin